MNIQQIIGVLEGAQKHNNTQAELNRGGSSEHVSAIEHRLNTAIENLRALQQLESMTATQEKSDWVLMPKHLTDDMVRAGVKQMLGKETGDGLAECLGPKLDDLYQSLIEARPQ